MSAAAAQELRLAGADPSVGGSETPPKRGGKGGRPRGARAGRGGRATSGAGEEGGTPVAEGEKPAPEPKKRKRRSNAAPGEVPPARGSAEPLLAAQASNMTIEELDALPAAKRRRSHKARGAAGPGRGWRKGLKM